MHYSDLGACSLASYIILNSSLLTSVSICLSIIYPLKLVIFWLFTVIDPPKGFFFSVSVGPNILNLEREKCLHQ